MSSLLQEPSSATQARKTRGATPQEPAAANIEQPASVEVKSTLDFLQVWAHLINECTFLAWTLTGMTLMGFGVAIAKMRIAISDFSQATGTAFRAPVNIEIGPVMMGLLFVVVGLLTIVLSTYRYLVVQNQLRKQKYTHADNFVLVFMLALTFLGGTLVLLVSQMR